MPLIKIFMKIFLKVKTKSRENSVERIDDSNYVVKVKEMPIEGKANIAVEKALAEYLGIASWRVKIKSGLTSKNKVAEII